ncbi:hypothetical protein FNH08_50265, partial [Streptomyces spongiae]|nr:hypothetical protein [Streptomyces spongiae]
MFEARVLTDGGHVTENDGEAWGGVECTEAEAELRQVLATRIQRAVPADVVVTTRAEIEQREFRAYANGWRDRGEHEARRGPEAHRDHGITPQQAGEAKVLPFPHQAPAQSGS